MPRRQAPVGSRAGAPAKRRGHAAPDPAEPEGRGQRRLRGRHVHEHHGHHHRQRGSAHHRARVPRFRRPPSTRWPSDTWSAWPSSSPPPGGWATASGPSGYSCWPSPCSPGRPPCAAWPAVLARAGPLPGHPRSGRRHADPGGHGHALPHLPARRTGPGRQHPHRHRPPWPRPSDRYSAACWSPSSVVAVGLLRQRSHRHRCHRLRLPLSSRSSSAAAPGALRPPRLPALRYRLRLCRCSGSARARTGVGQSPVILGAIALGAGPPRPSWWPVELRTWQPLLRFACSATGSSGRPAWCS